MSVTIASLSEPKSEELMVKLKKLQHAKEIIEEELKETQLLEKALQEEEGALIAEALGLESTLREKEEVYKILQFKWEALEQESQRHLEQNQQKEELVQQYNCRIQETKLRHRKIRMKFENQLQQLMGQHKNLCSVFTTDRLPAEVLTAENTTTQLLRAEQQRLEQLAKLQELNKTHSLTVQENAGKQ